MHIQGKGASHFAHLLLNAKNLLSLHSHPQPPQSPVLSESPPVTGSDLPGQTGSSLSCVVAFVITLLAKITPYSNFFFALPGFELIKLPIRSLPIVELIRTQEVLPRRFLVHALPHTATAQPLDVAYNFPLKASLTRVATAHFSKLLLDAIESDDKGARQVDTRMSSLKPLLPHWVGVALNELSLRDDVREFGWRHLFVPAGEDREAVIAAAQELHEEEKLFRPVGASCGGIPEEQPSDGEDPPAAAADEDEEEEEEELALLSPPPDEVDELEVEMELMEESMELPKEVMGEPMEETPNEPGTQARRHQRQHHHPRSTKRPRCSRSSSACDWHAGTSHLQECKGNSQNPSCVQELPLHLLLEKRQHVHLSYKELVSAWSEEREQRERKKEREREKRTLPISRFWGIN